MEKKYRPMLTSICESLHYRLIELEKNNKEHSANEALILEELNSVILTEKQKENRRENLKEIEYQLLEGAKEYNKVYLEFEEKKKQLHKLQNGN